MNAAIIYQHASSEADRAIAEAVDGVLQQERSTASDDNDGPADALISSG